MTIESTPPAPREPGVDHATAEQFARTVANETYSDGDIIGEWAARGIPALARAYLALRVPAAPVSGEPDRVVRWEVTLRNVVSLVSGWQQGCAPGEWTDYDADVLSQLTALRKEVVDHLAALRAGGPTP